MLEMWNNTRTSPQRSHGHEEHVDDWHHHGSAEGEPQEEHSGQVNTGIILKWFVVIMVFVTASIAFIVIYFNQYSANLRATTVETVMSGDFLSYRLQSQQHLSSHGQPTSYTGLAGGRVQGPVADAMKKVVGQYKDGKTSLSAGLPEGHPVR
ncbi:MAG: hypothetical protein U0637_09395 [Phycisphaerales bacterium]